MNANPVYSICMCNYNMADTIEQSLTSLLSQIDHRFEVVLVDDGSTDDSVSLVKAMQRQHANLRLVSLARDRRRKLGMTRNISIEQAHGDYVLLHLDCDDIFGPHLVHFVEVFHRIEACLGRDILLSGQHINMAKRQFLLLQGGYLNIYRGEDRDLWRRMAAIDAYVPLDHVDFIQRLPKKRSKRTLGALINTYDHLRNDFRAASSIMHALRDERSEWPNMSWKLRILRSLLLFPAWVSSLRKERIHLALSHDEIAAYRNRMQGSFSDIMRRHGGDPSLAFLGDAQAIHIFSSVKKNS